jgi:transcriptional regulator with XRE-family HTH domain
MPDSPPPDEPSGSSQEPSAALLFARRLQRLMRVARNEKGEPYSYNAVARAIGTTASHVTRMANVEKPVDVQVSTMLRMAQFFGVPVEYFVNNGDLGNTLERELENLFAIRQSGIIDLAARDALKIASLAQDLSPSNLRTVMEVVRLARHMQGLDPEPPQQDP